MHCPNMVIKLSIDVGVHDVYSAIDVIFARECEGGAASCTNVASSEVSKLINNAVPGNTKKATKHSLHIFNGK